MLKTRILTAVLLLATFLVALFGLDSTGWVAFATLVAALGAWEWGGFMRLSRLARVLVGVGVTVLCAGLAFRFPVALGVGHELPEAAWTLGRWFYIPASAFWLLVVPVWMRRRWSLPTNVVGLLVGLLVILPAWLALIQLRLVAGELVLILILSTVWLADVAAYAFGRSLGRHKLAPTISPGKTWEGALGGGLAVLVYGLILLPRVRPDLDWHTFILGVVLILLSVISVVGDLFESLLKRQVGMKDSSSILPGHGGVLDRIDSLTSTLPVVTLFWLAPIY